jgi:hypothetical protein
MNLTSNPKYNERRAGLSLDKLVHSARLLSLTKSKKWLHKIIDKGLIVTQDNLISVRSDYQKEQFKLFIDTMLVAFSRKYGDNWDVHLVKENMKQYSINFFTIFPSITITNSENCSHVIKDLIVVFPIGGRENIDKFFIRRIQGGRASYAMKEIDNQYSHSHLKSSVSSNSLNEPFHTDEFCIGAGDLSFLETVLRSNFNVRDLEGFLYEVDATVQWESIQGTPYKHIKDLTGNKNSIVKESSYSVSGFVSQFIPVLDVDFYISNNTYKIKFNDTFKAFIRNSLEGSSYYNQLLSNILCTYNPATRRYYKASSGASSGSYLPDITSYGGEDAYTIYNGQKKYFSIKPNQIGATAPQETYIIYPKFLQNVHTEFEKLLHEKAVRQSAISKYHSAEYQSSYSPQNTISL